MDRSSELLDFEQTKATQLQKLSLETNQMKKKRKQAEESEEQAQRDWHESLSQAKKLLSEERREQRDFARKKQARRKAQGGLPAQGGKWIEGMAAVARRGREDGMH
eukprot:gb/GEZN01014588.1/.p1 GENE.gb/GEZN01014588.1/~~gb/GEZN01014588.1/.p1  ORF type:complete len:106 (+),score=27.49 gb/GEZN01014588.1/:259-576(+)